MKNIATNLFHIDSSLSINNIAIHNINIVKLILKAAYFDCVEPITALTNFEAILIYYYSIYTKERKIKK